MAAVVFEKLFSKVRC